MDEKQMKTVLIDTFNTVSGDYDAKPLRFSSESAGNMASLHQFLGSKQVLDVACGR